LEAEEYSIIRSLMICISHQLLCYWVDGIKEGEVGGECDVYMEEKRNA
jgi:hypothetical protein